MGPFLGSEWQEALTDHESACGQFETLWQQLFPTSTRCHETPKRHLLWRYAPKQIEHTKCSLGLYSEQPFETTHLAFAEHSLRWKIPRTAAEAEPRARPRAPRRRKASTRKRTRSEVSDAWTPAPKKQKQPKKQKKRSKKAVAPSFGSGMDVEKAKLQRYRAVRAWNAERLPATALSLQRQAEAVAIHLRKGDAFLVEGEAPWNVER